MTEEDRAEFMRHLTVLAETFGEPMTSARFHGYFVALDDLPLEAIQRGIETALSTCRYFPRPAELRELAGEILPDVGLVEAALVAHLRANVGQYNAVPADPFLQLVCERLGGPYAMGEMSTFERLQALKGIVPGVIAAARVRGIPLLSHAEPDNIRLAYRERHMALGAPVPEITQAQAVAVLEQVWPKPAEPLALPAPSRPHVDLTDEQVQERKAELRAQAERLKP